MTIKIILALFTIMEISVILCCVVWTLLAFAFLLSLCRSAVRKGAPTEKGEKARGGADTTAPLFFYQSGHVQSVQCKDGDTFMSKTKTTKQPVLTVTFNWSGEFPKKVQRKWAALMKPKTIKLSIPKA